MGSFYYGKFANTPCRECHELGNNYEACHDTCPQFLAAKAERDERLRQIFEAKSKTREIDKYEIDQMHIRKKIKKWKGESH